GWTRHRVVHEGWRKELTLVVIDDVLHHRLADALSESALHLSFDDHRIDYRTHVIDGEILLELDASGAAVNFNHRKMHRLGIVEVRRIVEDRHFEARLETGIV